MNIRESIQIAESINKSRFSQITLLTTKYTKYTKFEDLKKQLGPIWTLGPMGPYLN